MNIRIFLPVLVALVGLSGLAFLLFAVLRRGKGRGKQATGVGEDKLSPLFRHVV